MEKTAADFRALVESLVSEFERLRIRLQALEQENLRLKTQVQDDLFTPRSQPQTPRSVTNSPRLGVGYPNSSLISPLTPVLSPRAEVDLWCQTPEVAVQPIVEEIEDADADSNAGKNSIKSMSKVSESQNVDLTYSQRRQRASLLAMGTAETIGHASSGNHSIGGMLQHYAAVLHRPGAFARSIVESTLYKGLISLLVVVDCLSVVWNVHFHRGDAVPFVPRLVSAIVCALFCTDFACRMHHYITVTRSQRISQDLLDVACLAIMILDEISLMIRGTTFKVSWASILRGIRLLRLFHVLHSLMKRMGTSRLLREFDWLLSAITSNSGWRTVLCVLFFISMIFMIIGIALTDGAMYVQCEDTGVPETNDSDLCAYFGTLRRSIFTLFKVTHGGLLWGDVLESLRNLSIVYAAIFAFFVMSYSILLLNVATGSILRICQEATDRQKYHEQLRNEAGRQEAEVHLMEQLFMEIDVNDNGAISRAEFELALKDPHMSSTFSVLNLHIYDLHAIFPLFDINGSGEISLDEFVLGCIRMKGEAKSLDVVHLQMSIRNILDELQALKATSTRPSEISRTHGSRPETGFMSMSGSELVVDQSRTNDRAASVRSSLRSKSMETQLKKPQKEMRFFGQLTKHGRQSIPRPEMRAMSLRELRDIPSFIEEMLSDSQWLDLLQGYELPGSEINLYHFNHYCICSHTTPQGIKLKGLQTSACEEGQTIVQTDPSRQSRVPLAKGEVLKRLPNGEIHVKVQQGRFSHNGVGDYPVRVNGIDCGVPTDVEAPGAFSFKELMSSDPLQPRWFCSHWWGERVFHFVKCCEEHSWRRRLGPDDAVYWVCAYANRQYDIAAELSDNPQTSSFNKALEKSQGLLLFLDERGTPFSRIWCCYELYLAIMSGTKDLDIVTVRTYKNEAGVTREVPILLSDGQLPLETQLAKTERERPFPMHLLMQGMRVDLALGVATVESDKAKILKAISLDNRMNGTGTGVSQNESDLQQANGALNAVFAQAAWLHALKRGVDLNDVDPPYNLSLPRILACDTRRKFAFSFEMFPEASNDDVLHLACGLSQAYTEIHLSFGNCKQITDSGVKDLSEHLPFNIETCRLDFVGCTSLTSRALVCLAEGLPPSVANLRLDFACCPEIDMMGVRYLAQHLPNGIKKFYATFPGTRVHRNFRSIAELQAACSTTPYFTHAREQGAKYWKAFRHNSKTSQLTNENMRKLSEPEDEKW